MNTLMLCLSEQYGYALNFPGSATRLKRSGAWWYEGNSNQMLALRCAKYNGTFGQVFKRHQQRPQDA